MYNVITLDANLGKIIFITDAVLNKWNWHNLGGAFWYHNPLVQQLYKYLLISHVTITGAPLFKALINGNQQAINMF